MGRNHRTFLDKRDGPTSAPELEPRDARLLAWLCAALRRTYTGGRRCYALAHGGADGLVRGPAVELDGDAGAALLTEIRHWLGPAGADVVLRREVYKRLLLQAICTVRLPYTVAPGDGWYHVGLKPRRRPAPGETLLRHTLGARLPDGVADRVLELSSWYACTRAPGLPAPGPGCLAASIDCASEALALRQLLRRALNYPAWHSCRLCFTHADPVAAEWCPEGRRIWLVAVSPWPFVELLRQLREQRGGSAELLHIKGYGPVFV